MAIACIPFVIVSISQTPEECSFKSYKVACYFPGGSIKVIDNSKPLLNLDMEEALCNALPFFNLFLECCNMFMVNAAVYDTPFNAFFLNMLLSICNST